MLLAQAPDNTIRLISPQRYRDGLVSEWGALLTSDPTVNDDNANTAGNGFFDSGSKWLNLSTPSIWECVSGAPGAAIWVKVYPQTPAVTSVAPVFGIVDAGPVAVTVSPPSGLGPYSGYLAYDGEFMLAQGSLNPVDDGPWIAHTGLWVRPAWYANGLKVYGTAVVMVGISSLGVGWKANLLYLLNAYSGGEPKETWIVGTDTPLFNTCNIGSLQVTSSDGSISLAGSLNPFPHRLDYDNTQDFTVNSVAGSKVSSPILTGVLPASFNPSGITLVPVTLGSTPYTIQLDTITDDLYFIDGAGHPQQVQTGGGGGTGFSPVSLSGTLTSTSFSTIYDETATNCYMGNLALFNNTGVSPGFIEMKVTIYDIWGHSFTSSVINVNGNNTEDIVNVASDSIGNGVFLPLTRVKVEAATDNVSFPQTWQIKGARALI